MQTYSDPTRESDPHALPDIEVFYQTARAQALMAVENDDDMIYDVAAESGQMVANVKHMAWFLDAVTAELSDGWFWWSCFPGCLPDSDPIGPFDTEAEAEADAQDF